MLFVTKLMPDMTQKLPLEMNHGASRMTTSRLDAAFMDSTCFALELDSNLQLPPPHLALPHTLIGHDLLCWPMVHATEAVTGSNGPACMQL